MLKAIESVKRYNRVTLIGALVTSYLHQAHYLASIGAGYFAYLPPAIFDTAMVSMLIVVRTHGIARDAKRAAMAVFCGAAIFSAVVNFAAPGDLGLRIIFALVVVLVIGVELVAGRIRPDFTAIDKQATELLAAANKIREKAAARTTGPVDTIPAQTPAETVINAVEMPATTAPTPAVTETPDVPAHLLHTARFSIVQHEQTTGRPITVDELATRMNVTPTIAGHLIAVVNGTHPAPVRINGTTPVLDGVR
ncbi:DUF2637 domain-containing protein [Actinoplanes philippinensis]